MATDPAPELRQRWRVTFAREQPPVGDVPTGREYIGRWEDALLAAGLPAALAASGRPRIALAAPLPLGCSAAAELIEFWLTEVYPAWAVRERLSPVLPEGHRLVGLQNVWLGAPAVSGQVAAADYEVLLSGDGPADAGLAAAGERLLSAKTLPRERQRGGGETKVYDLRPLLLRVEASGPTLSIRTRIHPELGTGRPEEVVAALGDELGTQLAIERIVRRRLLLAGELDDGEVEAPVRTLD